MSTNQKKASKDEKPSKMDVVTLPIDKFVIVDSQLSYIFNGGYLYLALEIPKDIKELITKNNLSSTGKTFRVYSNGVNRKFIKNGGYSNVQIQINSFISTKDADNLEGLTGDQKDAIDKGIEIQEKAKK